MPRNFILDQDAASGLELQAGINVLVFKVINEGLRWGGSLRFSDAAAQPVKGLRVSLAPGP